MSGAGDQFVWNGTLVGSWTSLSNWDDVTAGENPALTLPGSLDSVTFNGNTSSFIQVSGDGRSASLTFNGDETVLGQLNTGTLVAGSTVYYGELAINAGGTISAAAASVLNDDQIAVNGSGAALDVAGTLSFTSGYLTAQNGARVQLGGLVLGGYQGVSADSLSSIEIGTAGTAASGQVVIDSGDTLAGSGSVNGSGGIIDNGVISTDSFLTLGTATYGFYGYSYTTLAGSGIVEATQGGTITVEASIAAGGPLFQIDGTAGLVLEGTIAAGNTISLLGNSNVLSLSSGMGGGTPSVNATVTGFNATDQLVVSGTTLTSAIYTPGTAGNPGTLTLLNGATTVDAIGLTGNFAGDTFFLGAISSSESEILLTSSTSSTAPSAGTDHAANYVWIGPAVGDWNTAANWDDVTDAANPAVIAPGSLDSVAFNGTTSGQIFLTGAGNSASLTLNGDETVLGQLNTGTLIAGSSVYYGELAINAGGTISAAAASVLDGEQISVSGTGAAFDVAGTLNFASSFSGGLAAQNGARVQLGGMALSDQGVSVDSLSSIEIGTAGTAASGQVVIDSGDTLAGSGSVNGSGGIIDNGVISTDSFLTLGTATYGFYGYSYTTLAGSGIVEATQGGTITVEASIAAGGPLFQIDGTAGLVLEGTIAAGNTISLLGNSNVLSLSSGMGGGTPSVNATVTGFNATDQLVVSGTTLTSAIYTPGTAGNPGTLTLLDGATTVDAIGLTGNFAGDTFFLGAISSSESEILLTSSTSSTAPSAGTDHAANYVWIGPAVGDWNTAANWDDVTDAANPAVIAPGSLDSVAFNGTTSGQIFLTGAGNSASLTLNGDETVLGQLNTGTLIAGSSVYYGELAINAGGTISAAAASVLDGEQISVSGTGAAFDVAGTLNFASSFSGGLAAQNGARVQLGGMALSDQGVSADSLSSIEIGSVGTAASGHVVIDSGHTLAGDGSVNGGVGIIDNGVISTDSFLTLGTASFGFYGYSYTTLAGSGTVEATQGGTITVEASIAAGGPLFQLDGTAGLVLEGTIAAGNTISLLGNDNVLSLSSGMGGGTPSVNATVTGFNATDQLVVSGTTLTSAIYTPGTAGNPGTLTLLDGATTVDAIGLTGNFAGDQFVIVSPNSTTEQISFVPVTSVAWSGAAGTSLGSGSNWAPTVLPTSSLDTQFLTNAGTLTGSATADHVTFGGGDGWDLDAGTFTALGSISIGSTAGTGLQLDNAATITALSVSVGAASTDVGNLTLTDSGTLFDAIAGGADIGESGTGQLTIRKFARFSETGEFTTGDAGLGSALIESGGTLVTAASGGPVAAIIGNTTGAAGSSVSVTGAGSDWQVEGGTLVVGNAASGALNISSGATVTAASLDTAASVGGDGVISVTGTNSSLTLTGSLTLGDQAAGELSILGGATVSAQALTVGNANAASSGNVDVEGAGSTLHIATGGVLNVGYAGGGSGELTIGQGSTLQFSGGVVEAGRASYNNNGGVIDPDSIEFTTASNAGLGENDYNLYVGNINAVQVTSGTGTWDTPMVLTGTSVSDATNNIQNNGDIGEWQLSNSGTLIVNANTVDSGQAIIFEDATDTLVIGQVVNGGSAGIAGVTPTIAAGAENLLAAGGFAAEIWGYQSGDRIEFNNLVVNSDSIVGGNTLDLFGNGGTLLGSLVFLTKAGNHALGSTAMNAAVAQIECFAAGTRIRTTRGEVKVEALREGDLAITGIDGSEAPVVWIGHREVDCARHPDPRSVWPVRIRAGAFGRGLPKRALTLSPDHAVYVNEVLVPVKHLINGTTIAQVKVDRVTYYHVELDRHDVLIADGLPAESYLDVGDRANFANGGPVVRLHIDLAHHWEAGGCAPLVIYGEELERVKAVVAAAHSEPLRPSGKDPARGPIQRHAGASAGASLGGTGPLA